MKLRKDVEVDVRKLRTLTNGSRYVCIPKDWINPDVKRVKVAKAKVLNELPENAIVIIPIEGST